LSINKNHYDITKTMLKKGKINVNQVTEKGSAIHEVLIEDKKRRKYRGLLMAHGANPELENTFSVKAVDLVEDNELKKTILEEYKAFEKANRTLSEKPPHVLGHVFKTG
jgi:hypothetical protein